MELSDFDFNLPHELIAKEPAYPRDAARIMVVGSTAKGPTLGIKDDHFYNLVDYFMSGDVLVLNNSKVFPARIFGKREDGKIFEILLLQEKKKSQCLVKPGKSIGDSAVLEFSAKLSGVVSKEGNAFILVFNLEGDELKKEIKNIGEMPIPPYILKERGEKHSEKKDEDEYQTVFAKEEGSVAAPTAGLHFTDELLEKLRKKGVIITEVTLHVGLGTFEPIREEDFIHHKMHTEHFVLNAVTAEILNNAKKEGRRIVACGTTTTRVLESVVTPCHSREGGNPRSFRAQPKAGNQKQNDKISYFKPQKGSTDIFIYPGYEFKAIDGMITNFHLPKSSLLLLVSTFMGKDRILEAYQHAIKNGYRFYSYGDGMLLLSQ